MASEYMIFHPEQADIISLFMFLVVDTNISHYAFFETNETTEIEDSRFSDRLLIVGMLIYMNFALSISGYLRKLTQTLEYDLNYLSLNRGLLGLIWRYITGSLITPQPDSPAYRSIRSFINRPIVHDRDVATMLNYVSLNDLESGLRTQTMMEIAVWSSELAYENGERIKDVVNNQWKMSFVEFFACTKSTEAFVYCDKETDASWIVLAFRGSSQCEDFVTDFDLSCINTKVMGSVHIGFMTALGLQDRKSFANGFPPDYTGSDNLAYYAIRALLDELLAKHKKAKILITGHSLGGALSVLFTSLLSYHGRKDIMDRIEIVQTFGQPRVGDEIFGKYINNELGDKYTRMVYRFDLVPRVPFDLNFMFKFKHFGACIYYEGWFARKSVEQVPNKNYFNLLYLPIIYYGYLADFAMWIWWGITKRRWEGFWGTIYRIACIILPGLVFHNTSNYTNAVTYAKVAHKNMA